MPTRDLVTPHTVSVECCSYEGSWVDDEPSGHGKAVYSAGRYPEGTTYVGQWVHGKCQGSGELTFPDGSKYAGEFANDSRSGRGVMVWPSGDKYSGMVSGATALVS